MSPTARTLSLLRKEGWTAQTVEKWIPQTKRRLDLFGFADILCCCPDRGSVLVQCTSVANQANRLAKVIAEPRARTWLLAGRGHHQIWVMGWGRKKLFRGSKAIRWSVTRTPVDLDMLPHAGKATG